jgi:D-alanine-D-alanine ligase-like ATP-grasp enzyme
MGATKVTEAGQLKAAWELAAQFDSLVLAEEFVAGQELTAPFLGERRCRWCASSRRGATTTTRTSISPTKPSIFA